MLEPTFAFFPLANGAARASVWQRAGQQVPTSDIALPASITRQASKQTFYTIRFLVDRDRVLDAYRAYAYFRWVDDTLDQDSISLSERLAFAAHQQALLVSLCQASTTSRTPSPIAATQAQTAEEHMLVDLVRNHPQACSGGKGLRAYLHHMMAIMTFDAERRGRLISSHELDVYSLNLSIAVTEALHFFVGHSKSTPVGDLRYRAVIGAHIAHMLRDAIDDNEAGYFNIPREVVDREGIDPRDVTSNAYCEWVASRVRLARECFADGRRYLRQVQSLRCRMAGYAYMVRFESVLDTIEREGYRLRRDYPERKHPRAVSKMIWSALVGCLGASRVSQSAYSHNR